MVFYLLGQNVTENQARRKKRSMLKFEMSKKSVGDSFYVVGYSDPKLWKNSFLGLEVFRTKLSFNSRGFIYQGCLIEKWTDASAEPVY